MLRLHLVRWEYDGRRSGLRCVWAADERGAAQATRCELLNDTTKRFIPAKLVICQITATKWMQVGEGVRFLPTPTPLHSDRKGL